MSATAVRAFGICTFIFGAFILFAGIGPREWIFGPPPKARLISALVFAMVTAVVGVGLLLLRKWAALVFSVTSIALPVWMGIKWFGQVQAAVYVMLFTVTVVLMLPIIIIIHSWRLLSWRGRSFL